MSNIHIPYLEYHSLFCVARRRLSMVFQSIPVDKLLFGHWHDSKNTPNKSYTTVAGNEAGDGNVTCLIRNHGDDGYSIYS